MKVISVFVFLVFSFLLIKSQDSESDVFQLTDENFDSTISEGFTLVKFYSPWCKHCKQIENDYKETATALKNKATIAEINCEKFKKTCVDLHVFSFPTIYLYKDGDQLATFSGERNAENFYDFVQKYRKHKEDL
ncbi:protein disulfide-isomerase c17h9.14c-related [Anaeramoeba ignava]|uniref:Protein disulfide-isomerase c17h9.14c-related n=1 Tax=Anaeramoeba ignava TaxID=1746090 RepID=A0A9Q0R9T4_ANAIG|nr:protein disulfide-isomerase c17h9.14c-related [Anaeramoeba ignava]